LQEYAKEVRELGFDFSNKLAKLLSRIFNNKQVPLWRRCEMSSIVLVMASRCCQRGFKDACRWLEQNALEDGWRRYNWVQWARCNWRNSSIVRVFCCMSLADRSEVVSRLLDKKKNNHAPLLARVAECVDYVMMCDEV